MPHRHRLLATFVALALAATVAVQGQSQPSHQSASAVGGADNVPALAAYCWGVAGLQRGHYDFFAKWLGREALWAEDFQAKETWDNIRNPGWQLRPWERWVKEVPGRRLILSVPLLPGDWKGSGPAKGLWAGEPVSLEAGAAGSYNAIFSELAVHLVAAGLQDSILRLGWEFNGGWYTWRAKDKEEAFAEYFRQVVTTMRAVEGGESFKFCWNPNNNRGQSDAVKAWPGAAYVDYIGVDVYDQSWASDTYPIPGDATPEETQRRREKAWDTWIHGEQRHGLAYWSKFAAEQKLPLAIPEWGTAIRQDGHAGGDNAWFIEQMHAFLTDPANNVAWHCYFDVDAPDGAHQLSTFPEDRPTRFPLAAQRFRELFGTDASAR